MGRHYTDGEKAAIARVRADVADLVRGLLAFVNGVDVPPGATILREPAADWNVAELRADLRGQIENILRGERPCPGAVDVTLTYWPEAGPARVTVQVVDDLHDRYQWTLLEAWRLGITTRVRRCAGCGCYRLLVRASHQARTTRCSETCRTRAQEASTAHARERGRVRALAERAALKAHASGHRARR